jgi:hypothetical protein
MFIEESQTYTVMSGIDYGSPGKEGTPGLGVIATYMDRSDIQPGQKGYVTRINTNAFAGNPYLTSVNIPYSIIDIGDYAFSGCSNLTTVSIANNEYTALSTIGEYAFADCKITGAVLPSTNISIGAYAFKNCGDGNNLVNCSMPIMDTTTFTNTNKITVYVNRNTYDYYEMGPDGTTYTENVTFLSPNSSSAPIAAICFTAGTLVETDQGEFPIESLTKHTLRGQMIQVTKTVQLDPWIVKIKARAFGSNPTRDTYVTKNHRIYQGSWVKAFDLVNGNTVTLVNHQGFLYNVLVDTHTSMNVHGMRVETLDPKEPTAKLYPRPKQSKKIDRDRFRIRV